MNLDNGLIPEDRLLLYCARTRLDAEAVTKIKSFTKTNLDWGYIVSMATRHKLKPLLYIQLYNICAKHVPKEIMDDLRCYYYSNARKNLSMYVELLKVLKFLESHGISAIPFKGPILAILVYGDLSKRDFDDLDIYVDQKNAFKTKNMLNTYGYKPIFYISPKKENKFIKTQYHYIFANDEHKIILELHWNFLSTLFSFNTNVPSMFVSGCHQLKLGNHEIIQLSHEDLFLLLCIHNAGHRWKRLQWLSDLNELLDSYYINWEMILKKSNQLGVMRILGINLSLMADLFDSKIPVEVLKQFDKDKKIKKISNEIKSELFSKNPNPVKLFDEVFLTINVRDKIILGIRDLIKSSVNPTLYEWINISIPSRFIFLYSFIRPFLLLKRYKW